LSIRLMCRGCRLGALLFALLLPSAVAWAEAADEPPVVFSVAGIDALGDAPDVLTLGAGIFNVIPNDDYHEVSPEGRLEYRYGRKWSAIGPMLGGYVNGEGGAFGYAAVYADLRRGDWIATPAFGVGAYREGDGKDLGGVFQFHMALDVAYAFTNGDRLGMKLTHVSNASLHDRNPGVESLLLTYTLSLGRFAWADR